MNKKWMCLAILFFALLLGGCISSGGQSSGSGNVKVLLYKSESCGCCTAYGQYLQSKGFNVEVKLVENMESIKQMYAIPRGAESCHTAVIGNYFVEGHVPIEAINKLLNEKPDIKGIGLAGMPSGSPGMPGAQYGPFSVYGLKNGEFFDFMAVGGR